MDKQQIYVDMEILRKELNIELECCLDNGGMSPRVLDLSQKLDKLIVTYMRLSQIRIETESNEVA